jgi:hypothetical protein
MPERINIFDDKGFKEWLEKQEQSVYWTMLFQYINQHRDDVVMSALEPGDTEWLKGKAEALRWVLDLPHYILADTKTDTRPDEVGHGSGNG